jgi:hypothetical protein
MRSHRINSTYACKWEKKSRLERQPRTIWQAAIIWKDDAAFATQPRANGPLREPAPAEPFAGARQQISVGIGPVRANVTALEDVGLETKFHQSDFFHSA